ncbi:MAG: ice-binding family protein [Candidatus Saccharimonadales bacterium]
MSPRFINKNINKYSTAAIFLVLFMLSVAGLARASHPPVDLGTTESFAVLAGTEITNVPTSAITGNVGLHPDTGAAITGLTCAEVIGTIYDVDGTYAGACEVTNEPLLNTAKQDLVTAYDDAASRTPVTTVLTELGGQTLTDGTYDSASTTFEITAGAGPLVLDGEGNPDAVFIFLMNSGATGLVVGPGSEVQLTGEAQACNVFWKLNTATIDTTAVFKGTILALTSITVDNGADIEGRLLARNGNVTLISDTITVPTCTVSSSDDTTGLPDTGLGPNDKNALWSILLPVGIFLVGVVSLFLARSNRTV